MLEQAEYIRLLIVIVIAVVIIGRGLFG